MAAALRPELLVAPWAEAGLTIRAAEAAPGCPLVAIREPSDPDAPADPGVALLDTPVLDVEIAAALQRARRQQGSPARHRLHHAPWEAAAAASHEGGHA
jgi:hypothetical protein